MKQIARRFGALLAFAVAATPAFAEERVPPTSAVRPHALPLPVETAPANAALPDLQVPGRPPVATTPTTAAPLTAPGPIAGPRPGPSAEAFVAKAETELATINELSNRVSWSRATFITADTLWLDAKISAEQSSAVATLARDAARYDAADVDAVTRRKLDLLKRGLLLPTPARAGAAAEISALAVKIDSIYSTGKVTYQGKTLTLEDVMERMRTSRDPAELKALWEAWHAVAVPMRGDYARLVGLVNEGAREVGYRDTGVLWRSWYDMPPDEFAAVVDRLWQQLEPLYRNLHCYARGRLNEQYGGIQPRTGPIRADLLSEVWAQDWTSIFDLLAPKNAGLGYDLTEVLKRQGYDAVKLARTAEAFYTSIGFAPLPQTFWERSMLVRPRDREVECHASAWDIDDRDDIRVKMCMRVNAEDFYTIHHELGHNMYQRATRGRRASSATARTTASTKGSATSLR